MLKGKSYLIVKIYDNSICDSENDISANYPNYNEPIKRLDHYALFEKLLLEFLQNISLVLHNLKPCKLNFQGGIWVKSLIGAFPISVA